MMTLSVIPDTVRADWRPTASLAGGVSTAYPQEIATFSYVLSIGTIDGVSSAEITSVVIKMDWESSGTNVCASTVVMTIPGTHTFTRNVNIPSSVTLGTHTVTVKITGQANGDWWTSDQTWTDSFSVEERADLISSIVANPSTGAAPVSISFDATVSGGTPDYTYSWNFGDGSSSSVKNPTHTYAIPGTFTVTLTVVDDLSRTATTTISIPVTAPLQVIGSADYNTGNAPLTIHFTSSVSGGTPSYSYYWNFGDGTNSVEASPSHIYSSAGTYQTTLTVTDAKSVQKTYSTSITVKVSTNPFDTGTASGGGFLGLGNMAAIIMIIIAIAIVAAVVMVIMMRKKGNNQPPAQ